LLTEYRFGHGGKLPSQEDLFLRFFSLDNKSPPEAQGARARRGMFSHVRNDQYCSDQERNNDYADDYSYYPGFGEILVSRRKNTDSISLRGGIFPLYSPGAFHERIRFFFNICWFLFQDIGLFVEGRIAGRTKPTVVWNKGIARWACSFLLVHGHRFSNVV